MKRDFLPVLTIGHSHHSREQFLALLRLHSVEVVLDVRSSPFSRRTLQYNRSELEKWLPEAGIRYSFGGRNLGGRPSDPRMYVRGRANYELMAATHDFVVGLRRVAKAAKSMRVALMCAEAEPIECHRFLLIGRALAGAMDVRHILANGRVEAHKDAERRLLATVGLAQSALFEESLDALRAAYALQSERVAYSVAVNPWDVAFEPER